MSERAARRPGDVAETPEGRRAAFPWAELPGRMRARGLRWTAQRRTLLAVLSATSGHVTGSELVERCRAIDPATVPSTVYRTLDVLESLGVVRHGHRPDGREEFHVLPAAEHGHLHCEACGRSWEIGPVEAGGLIASIAASRGFEVDLSHLSISGRCATCAGRETERGRRSRAGAAPG